ncbi:hypothetical protein PG997_007862 [Apiospora hydei]|uniref:Uncharacterized protein n=1 Tax=Apiospora hydei TaxID=1337664 RepID=A0ABR1WD08_9PEZI
MSAAFSATAYTVACKCVPGIIGMTEASTTANRRVPCTSRSAPTHPPSAAGIMAQVPLGCALDGRTSPRDTSASHIASSVCAAAPGATSHGTVPGQEGRGAVQVAYPADRGQDHGAVGRVGEGLVLHNGGGLCWAQSNTIEGGRPLVPNPAAVKGNSMAAASRPPKCRRRIARWAR